MRTMTVWLIILTLSLDALSFPVAIRTLDSSREEFEGFLESQKGKIKSYSQNYIDNNTDALKAQKIASLYEQGIRYSYAGSKTIAAHRFSEIVAMAYDSDWPGNQVSMIVLAHLKLAEIYTEKREAYLKLALNFQYNFQNIPTEISSAWKKEKGKIPTKKWDLTTYKQFDFVIVNSRAYDLRDTTEIELPMAEHRISFVSDLFKSQTFKMSPDQLAVVVPPTIPFVDGDCTNPSYENGEPIIIFFDPNCIKSKTGHLWTNYDKSKKPDLMPSASGATNFSYTPPTDPFYKKTWFWAAMGVAAGVLIYSSTKKESGTPSVETVTID